MTLRLIPVIIEAIPITTMTPIPTPRIVSDARTLLPLIESSAIPTPSPIRPKTVATRSKVIPALSASIGSSREARLAG